MPRPFYGNGVSEALFESGLCLPSGTNLAPTDQELILDILRKNLQPLT